MYWRGEDPTEDELRVHDLRIAAEMMKANPDRTIAHREEPMCQDPKIRAIFYEALIDMRRRLQKERK